VDISLWCGKGYFSVISCSRAQKKKLFFPFLWHSPLFFDGDSEYRIHFLLKISTEKRFYRKGVASSTRKGHVPTFKFSWSLIKAKKNYKFWRDSGGLSGLRTCSWESLKERKILIIAYISLLLHWFLWSYRFLMHKEHSVWIISSWSQKVTFYTKITYFYFKILSK
jgi:hypothetical protein